MSTCLQGVYSLGSSTTAAGSIAALHLTRPVARMHTRVHTGDMGMACGCIWEHMGACTHGCIWVRAHTGAYGSILVHAHTGAYGSMAHTGCIRVHAHTGAYGRQVTSTVLRGRTPAAGSTREAASEHARASARR